MTAIVGKSGSGKSTLMNILGFLDVPSAGHYYFEGKDVSCLSDDALADIRNQQIGFIFQSFQLLPGLTAVENVMLPMELRGDKRTKEQASEFLARVGLSQRLHHYPQQLSGGEQQRVAIARAFASQPKILFADEPTGNLDTATGARVIDLLFELNREEGTTLLLITHEERLAERCQRRIELAAGRLVSGRE